MIIPERTRKYVKNRTPNTVIALGNDALGVLSLRFGILMTEKTPSILLLLVQLFNLSST